MWTLTSTKTTCQLVPVLSSAFPFHPTPELCMCADTVTDDVMFVLGFSHHPFLDDVSETTSFRLGLLKPIQICRVLFILDQGQCAAIIVILISVRIAQ